MNGKTSSYNYNLDQEKIKNSQFSFSTKSFVFIDYTEISEELSLIIFDTRNRPEVRQYLSNPDIIKYSDHQKFLLELKRTGSNQSYYAIISNGSYCGSVNIKRIDENTIERGILIHPDFQHKGLAKKISIEFYAYLYNRMKIKYVKTAVMKDNMPSISLQLFLGAQLISIDKNYNYYILDIEKLFKFQGMSVLEQC